MSAVELFLIVLIFVVLIGFLVLLIAFGASLTGQVSSLATKLEVAIQQAFVTIQALVNNVATSLKDFSDTAINALEGVGAKVGQAFGSVATFFRDEILGTIETITVDVANVAANLGRTIVKGLASIATTSADVINEIITWVGGILTSIFGLISQAYTLVSQFISKLILFIVQGVTTAISLVLDQLIDLINLISGGISISITAITNAINSLSADITSGFATLQSIITTISNAFAANGYLEMKLLAAFNIVATAVTNMFSGFMCSVLAPFCSLLPSVIAPAALCNLIRSAGGC